MPVPPVPGPRPELSQRTVGCIRRAYESADDLLLHLADHARAARHQVDWLDHNTADQAILAGQIIKIATSSIWRWREHDPEPVLGGQYAAADALAAVLIHGWAPAIAEELTVSWDTAVDVRAGLRDLGDDRAEAMAARLLVDWPGDDLADLPMVVANLLRTTGSP